MSKKKREKYVPTVKKNRPVSATIAVRDVNDRYSTYPSDGLTPKRLAQIFREADGGDVFRQMELFEEMEGKDTHLFSQLQTRKLAVTGLDWEVQPFSPSETDKAVAEFVAEQLRNLDDFSDNIMDMLDAIGKGISFQEIEWGYQGGHTVINGLEYVPPKKFFWDAMTDEIKVRTDDYPAGIELPEHKFVIHKYKARSGHPSKAGILRVVAWMYLFKNYDVKDWVSFCEVFGMPLRLGTYDATASEDDKQALMDAIVQLGTDAAGIVPKGTSIEFIESQKQSSVDIYEKLARFCDEQISKAVVGQTMTADSGSSEAQSKTHNEVRKDLTAGDCKALMATVRRDIITPLVLYNFGQGVKAPYFVINSEDADDLKEVSEIYTNLSAAGLEIPKKFLYKKFGIPEPEEGEPVLKRGDGEPVVAPVNRMSLKNDVVTSGQSVIDHMADMAVKESSELFKQVMKPIMGMIDNCESLEDLQKKMEEDATVEALYNSMDIKDFDKLLEKVLYVSNMIGRAEDG